ncbi:fatty-acid peroxygenase [Pilimelia anulata]|uniref:Fatty-acid peroxygenase n=1 Tax=Pilimelia anulata TaxID=53371 RepID=A0A8J3BB84_9ACTN|nr:cytochrome P450 [Pilimelia anulata]GGJ94851.1 fatty-acid peroxygenase [Pilimelia anulata]
MDHTLDALLDGYAWLPALRRRHGSDLVRTRVLGRRAVVLCGPGAAEFFADDRDVQRGGVVPEPVRATLFGEGAVHGLDGAAHRHRKDLFLRVLAPERVTALVDAATAAWDARVAAWSPGDPVSLHTESAAALAGAAALWAAVPATDDRLAADLVAMVDGFATLGPRHWRARAARRRREAQLAGLVAEVRAGVVPAPADSALAAVAAHREPDGQPLDPGTAAVELLNLLRPTVATSWLVMFAGHALHRWPELRPRLADPRYATAFAHEVRRFYPFAPFVGGRAARELYREGHRIPAGTLILLDVFGQNHDPELWPDPYRFDPERFLDREPGEYDLIPQGAGDPATGHRCPGEPAVVRLLAALAPRLAALDYAVPGYDLRISLRRIPARVADGMTVLPVAARVPA